MLVALPLFESYADCQRLAADAWGVDESTVKDVFDPLIKWFNEEVPGMDKARYPPMHHTNRFIARSLREILLSVSASILSTPSAAYWSQEELCREYASYFEGKSTAELDALAKSFAFENCDQRERLNEILRADAARAESTKVNGQ